MSGKRENFGVMCKKALDQYVEELYRNDAIPQAIHYKSEVKYDEMKELTPDKFVIVASFMFETPDKKMCGTMEWITQEIFEDTANPFLMAGEVIKSQISRSTKLIVKKYYEFYPNKLSRINLMELSIQMIQLNIRLNEAIELLKTLEVKVNDKK